MGCFSRRLYFKKILVVLIVIIGIGSHPMPVYSQNNGAVIGAVSGFLVANAGKDIVRKRFWLESIKGILVGGVAGAMVAPYVSQLPHGVSQVLAVTPYTMGVGMAYGVGQCTVGV
jgi:hypothetical protein